jgi:hypothetical protein
MTIHTYKFALLVILLAISNPAASQDAPQIEPGYATEGRPGFVSYPSTGNLPWERINIPNVPSGLQAKVLSRDDKRGGVALMASLPIGWNHETRGYHNANTEIFVLDGDMQIGDQKLTRYSYTFIPAGTTHGPVTTRHGAVFLLWFDKTPDFVPSGDDKPGARTYAAVRDWNYYHAPFDSVNFPIYRKGSPIPGVRLKLLRNDPDTGEMTWITHSMASSRRGSLWEVHPTFEEYFLLERSGEFTSGECLSEGPVPIRYEERGYWWRPAGVGHIGPISISTGYGLSLVRTGGPLWADYVTDCSYSEEGRG